MIAIRSTFSISPAQQCEKKTRKQTIVIGEDIPGLEYAMGRAHVLKGLKFRYEVHLSVSGFTTLMSEEEEVARILYHRKTEGPHQRGTWSMFIGDNQVGTVSRRWFHWKYLRLSMGDETLDFRLSEKLLFRGYTIKTKHEAFCVDSHVHIERHDGTETDKLPAVVVGMFIWQQLYRRHEN